jgi:hypothetical protein
MPLITLDDFVRPMPIEQFSKVQLPVSNGPGSDMWFNGWETASIKAMVIEKVMDLEQENCAYALGEAIEISPVDTSSDTGVSALSSLHSKIENRVAEWLQDVADQPQYFIEDNGMEWNS